MRDTPIKLLGTFCPTGTCSGLTGGSEELLPVLRVPFSWYGTTFSVLTSSLHRGSAMGGFLSSSLSAP